jgi:hypothetical protein
MIVFTTRGEKMPHQGIEGDVFVPPHDQGNPEEGEPDENNARHLFRPGKRAADDIPEKNLNPDQGYESDPLKDEDDGEDFQEEFFNPFNHLA